MGIWFKDWVDSTFLPLYHCFCPHAQLTFTWWEAILFFDINAYSPISGHSFQGLSWFDTLLWLHHWFFALMPNLSITWGLLCLLTSEATIPSLTWVILVFIWASTVVCLATVIGQWLLWMVKAFCDTYPSLSWPFTAWSLVNSDHHSALGGFMQGHH